MTCLPRLNRKTMPPEGDLFQRVVIGTFRTERRRYFVLLTARRARNRDPVSVSNGVRRESHGRKCSE